jgi:hypothetical protein
VPTIAMHPIHHLNEQINIYHQSTLLHDKNHLNVSNLSLEIIQFLLNSSIFFGHLLVLRLPLVAVLLEGLNFTLEVAGLDIGLTEPSIVSLHSGVQARNVPAYLQIDRR